MRTWTGQPAWGEWSERLAVATADDFERSLVPILRVLWPTLQQAPRLQSWDRKGIDLLVWAESGPFPCVIQCKGFKVQDIDGTQLRDVEDSIQKFVDSGVCADTYVVAHNRDGRNREFAAAVEARLQAVVAAKRAKEALLWDRQRLLARVFDRMQQLVEAMLRDRSRELSVQFRSLFRFADCHVSEVPVSERRLVLQRGVAPQFTELHGPSVQNPASLLEQASGTSWVILSGQFGAGKTTAALSAAVNSTRHTVFVPCQAVSADVFSGGTTSGLLTHVADELPALEHVPDEDRPAVARIARTVIIYLLRKPKSDLLFVLDGLDEHHVLATLSGLQRLSNQLAEFSCPVVLTTRREHLEAMLGDFNAAMSQIGSKYRSQREARVLYLEQWTNDQSLLAVRAAAATVEREERARLEDLGRSISCEQTPYGELVRHPLFLQFILEDVAEGGGQARSRTELIRSWVQRKLRRDRENWVAGAGASRPQVREGMDTEEHIDRMCAAMSKVAIEMTVHQGASHELSESLPAARVLEIMGSEFGAVELLPVLLNSVLTTLGPRRGREVPIGFALRILQEYFLASALNARGEDIDGWPATVGALARELASETMSL